MEDDIVEAQNACNTDTETGVSIYVCVNKFGSLTMSLVKSFRSPAT